MILVVGSTGTLGRKLTRLLLRSGEKVRAMTRVIADADELKALGARPVRGDLRDPGSIEFAVRGARAVIAAAHSILGRRDSASDIIDDAGHRSLIDAAKAAGVEHFIYMSVVGASPDHPLDFWRTKARIERYLEGSGLTYTIIRPTAFMEVHAYQLIGKAVMEGKRVMLFGKGQNPRNFVAAEDVAAAINGALHLPALRGQAIDMGGPDNLTSCEVVATFERLAGRKAKVTHIPLPLLRAMSRTIAPVHPGVSRIIRLGVISETTDQTFDATQFRTRMPIRLTTLEEWIRARLNK
ncbi:MAG TPA: SDR family oxidoreductase [Gemmatimonadaceae bacterium]|nr:SDR family oxidoreductase [Gemmatimonadaceae bacterium]